MGRLEVEQRDVRALQELAQRSAHAATATKPKQRSRAAYLELIDMLSRWSAAGLALIAGIGVYLAIAAGRAYPARAAVWTLLLLAALWVCRRMRSQFRAGEASSGRPFRWRASYTSALCVLGVIFASAPILLTPVGALSTIAMQSLALAMIGAFGASLFHAPHLPSALAFAAPGVLFPALAAVRSSDALLPITVVLLSSLAVAGLLVFNRVIIQQARRRNPRTSFLRSEVEPSGVYAGGAATTPDSHAQNAF